MSRTCLGLWLLLLALGTAAAADEKKPVPSTPTTTSTGSRPYRDETGVQLDGGRAPPLAPARTREPAPRRAPRERRRTGAARPSALRDRLQRALRDRRTCDARIAAASAAGSRPRTGDVRSRRRGPGRDLAAPARGPGGAHPRGGIALRGPRAARGRPAGLAALSACYAASRRLRVHAVEIPVDLGERAYSDRRSATALAAALGRPAGAPAGRRGSPWSPARASGRCTARGIVPGLRGPGPVDRRS